MFTSCNSVMIYKDAFQSALATLLPQRELPLAMCRQVRGLGVSQSSNSEYLNTVNLVMHDMDEIIAKVRRDGTRRHLRIKKAIY